jgi:hypothetical protein|tara:strand:- start:160 stop:306 length:147 start_codon:yes stop_codon:yes gene_type:complete
MFGACVAGCDRVSIGPRFDELKETFIFSRERVSFAFVTSREDDGRDTR